MGMVTVAMVLAQPVLSRGHIVSAITVNVNMVTSIVKVMVMVEVMVSINLKMKLIFIFKIEFAWKHAEKLKSREIR